MIKNIRHTGIVVENLDRSIAFYCNLLGFKIAKQQREKGEYISKILGLTDADIITVKLTSPDGQMIELVKYDSHDGQSRNKNIYDIGISHLAFGVDDLNAFMQRLLESGIKFISEPALSPDAYARVAFCYSPEKTLIELVEVL